MSYPTPLIKRHSKSEIMMVHKEKIKDGYKCLVQPIEITDNGGQFSKSHWVAKYTR